MLRRLAASTTTAASAVEVAGGSLAHATSRAGDFVKYTSNWPWTRTGSKRTWTSPDQNRPRVSVLPDVHVTHVCHSGVMLSDVISWRVLRNRESESSFEKKNEKKGSIGSSRSPVTDDWPYDPKLYGRVVILLLPKRKLSVSLPCLPGRSVAKKVLTKESFLEDFYLRHFRKKTPF